MNKFIQLGKEFLARKLVDIIKERFKRFNTPMESVLINLKAEQILPKRIIALELFARYGLSITKDYYDITEYLEMYEFDPFCAKFAKFFFSEAKVINVDSIETVRGGRLLRHDYNFIVIDNPDIPLHFGNRYCEHFDLFPYLIDKVANDAIFVMNVVLNTQDVFKKYPKLDYTEWLNRRAMFYGLEANKTVLLKPSEIKFLYTRKFNLFGNVEYINVIPRRNLTIGFLIVYLRKS